MVPRWWRNRVERPLSTQQIHQKIICVQSNPHRTTSECWWRIQMPSKANQSSQYEVWCVLVIQSCLTLCIPMDCSPLGSSVLGISQARILGEQPFLSLGNLPDPGIEPRSPTLQVNSLPSEPLGKSHFYDKSLNFGTTDIQFRSVQLLHRVWPCDREDHSTPGLPVHHQLPKFTQAHVR